MEINNSYGLPDIKREGLTDLEFQHRLKYRGLYIRLVERCLHMTSEELSDYYEVHHILPKCMKGTNIKSNLVKMPARYHIMAHIVLVEAFPNYYKLHLSLNFIINGKSKESYKKEDIIQRSEAIRRLSSRTIARIREDHLKVLKSEEYRASISGPNNPLYGKHLSEETKKKLSIAGKGKKRSKEFIENLRRVNLGRHHTEETKKKLSELKKGSPGTRLGAVLSEETKKKISKSRSGQLVGGDNPAARKVISPEGIIYPTVKEAAEKNSMSTKKLRSLLLSENSEWNYFNK